MKSLSLGRQTLLLDERRSSIGRTAPAHGTPVRCSVGLLYESSCVIPVTVDDSICSEPSSAAIWRQRCVSKNCCDRFESFRAALHGNSVRAHLPSGCITK